MLAGMVRRISSAVFVCVGWLACVGDDAAAPEGAATGELGGPCFSDGKCKEGLACNPAENVCAEAAGAVDGGTDGASVEDSGNVADTSVADGDAADAPTLACELSLQPGVRCPTTACTGVASCCIDPDGTHTCTPSSCAGAAKKFECDSKSVCGAGTKCCAKVATEGPGTACTRRAALTLSYCEAATCQGGSLPTCRTAADCAPPDTKCILTEVELVSGVQAVWGFCGNN